MQLGVPTLCSGEGSLPEIAGNASVIVDPYDITDIARGLERLDGDADLRNELSILGASQVKKFDATEYKKALVDMYDTICSGHRV